MNLTHSKNSNTLVGIYLKDIPYDYVLKECLFSICEQTSNVDLLVLVNKEISENDLNTIKSALENPSIVKSYTDESGNPAQEVITSANKLNYSIVEYESTNFSRLFNYVFNTAKKYEYESFSIIEKEDAYSLKWFENFEQFKNENENIGIFTPLLRNVSNGVFNGVMNEAPWAEGFAEEAGKCDINLLLRYNCINPLGAVYMVSKLAEYSEHETDENENAVNGSYKPMKESMKISHYYEFFLRMTYNDIKIMTIPRLGYEIRFYTLDYFNQMSSKIPINIASIIQEKGGVSQDEGRFWMELAKKEYFFDEDRNRVFSPTV